MDKKSEKITAEMQVEDLLDRYPQTVGYFIANKVSPFSCAGAYPKKLGEMLSERHVDDVEGFIRGLNAVIEERNS